MILYNVTVNIDVEKEEEYVAWMKEEHIPDVMSTGLFEENRFFKLLQENTDEGVNYSSQYFAGNMEKIETYQRLHAAKLQQKLRDRFGKHCVSFRSLLESVE